MGESGFLVGHQEQVLIFGMISRVFHNLQQFGWRLGKNALAAWPSEVEMALGDSPPMVSEMPSLTLRSLGDNGARPPVRYRRPYRQ